MKVFISHTFADDDQELALKLQKILDEENIDGYLAEKKKEYDLLIRDKIRKEIEKSDHMVAIITNKAKESASVNQELGYALREGIKPIIMLEENAKSGVLTHGIEPEEFSREYFEQSCIKVRQFLLKKGSRNKISDEERKWLIDNVYRPCYDSMKNVYESRDFITQVPPNPWKDALTHSQRLNTEPEMKELFENYTKEHDIWNKMWIIDFGNKFTDKIEQLGEILKPVFEKYGLLDTRGVIMAGRWSKTPKDWLYNAQFVICNEKIRDRDELYQILKNDAKRRYGEEPSQHLDEWHNNNPEIFTYILKSIPKLVKILDTRYSYAELDKQRRVLRDIIEKLTLALEEKLK